ncbi:MAG: hypothetical protein ACOYON_14480, partial [Fimbriimonas sp.]
GPRFGVAPRVDRDHKGGALTGWLVPASEHPVKAGYGRGMALAASGRGCRVGTNHPTPTILCWM